MDHGDETTDVDGARIYIGGEWYTATLMEQKSVTDWTVLYSPDDQMSLFFMCRHCHCGRRELRVMVGYEKYKAPGTALADYRLHQVGDSVTFTPQLNVLWVKQLIKGGKLN